MQSQPYAWNIAKFMPEGRYKKKKGVEGTAVTSIQSLVHHVYYCEVYSESNPQLNRGR
jgi:hypothetical protein